MGETVQAFVPAPLPPANPPLDLGGERARLLGDAIQAVMLLQTVASDWVPADDWFVYAFVRKESVLTSQIEGTQATLVDLLAHEATRSSSRPAEVEEVSNHVAALEYARAQLSSPRGLPLSLRLLNQTHRRLMKGVRGRDKQPGVVRVTQNWVGGARPREAVFVPPPPQLLPELLTDLERFIQPGATRLHPVVQAGLAHVQFETIHPYLDGNGRVGRLLISLILEAAGELERPLLYLSGYLKAHRDEYYARLSSVRARGDWEGWMEFFLQAVASTASEALALASKLRALIERHRRLALNHPAASLTSVQLYEQLPHHPMINVALAMELLEVSKPAAIRAIEALEAAGVLRETTGRKRDRLFGYHAYLELLRVGTDAPLRR